MGGRLGEKVTGLSEPCDLFVNHVYYATCGGGIHGPDCRSYRLEMSIILWYNGNHSYTYRKVYEQSTITLYAPRGVFSTVRIGSHRGLPDRKQGTRNTPDRQPRSDHPCIVGSLLAGQPLRIPCQESRLIVDTSDCAIIEVRNNSH